MSEDARYLIRWRGRQTGPFSLAELNQMLDDHRIGMGHEILFENGWVSLEEFFARTEKTTAPRGPVAAAAPAPEDKPLVRLKVPVAPPMAAAPASRAPIGNPRHRLVFALLAVLLGFTGVHNFYARQWTTGALQLLLSVATFLMGFGVIATWIWAMVEALAVRRDGLGNEMT